MKKIDVDKIENAFRDILDALGENVKREGLEDTPKRVAQSYGELFLDFFKILKMYLKEHLKWKRMIS